MSKTLGENLKVFASYDPWVMNLIFSLIVAAATEVTSNTAMATLLMPILAQVVSLQRFPVERFSSNYIGTRKVQVGKDQEKAQSEKDSHSKNRGGKKLN